MNYESYKKFIKELRVNSKSFAIFLDVHQNTPTTNWKPKNKIPNHIELVLELLKELPIEKRLMFIHNKLEEREKENTEK